MLKRLETTRFHTIGPERAELVEKATQLFGGYNVNDRKSADSLKAALNHLQIAPIDPASVRKYKRSKEVHRRIYTPAQSIAGFLLIVSATTLGLSFWKPEVLYHLQSSPVWNANTKAFETAFDMFPGARVAGLLASIVVCIVCIGVRYANDHKTYLKRTWESVTLGGFGLENIPDFALDRAIQIKQVCHDAEFRIEYLKEQREEWVRPRPPRDVDPFLVASLGAEHFYVDVWDEYDFERKV